MSELRLIEDRIYAKTPFELKDIMKSIEGRRWDADARQWHFPATATMAGTLVEVVHGATLDDGVRALVAQAQRERDAAQNKLRDDHELADIPGRLPAWLHQKRAFHFAVARRSTMLAMDMGTGKSRTAVSLLDEWDTDITIILCPRSVARVWPNQFDQHSERDWETIVPPPNQTVTKRALHITEKVARALLLKRPAAVIVNYEAAWREPMKTVLRGLAQRGERTTLILDECHKIKAPGGKASVYASLLAKDSVHVLGLTGTPMPHSPLDLYAQYRALDPGVFGTSYNRFKNRYAIMGGFEMRQVVGYQHADELAAKFGAHSFVVRKDEAGLDLPPVLHVPDVTEHTKPEGPGVFELEDRSAKAYHSLSEDFILGIGDGTVTAANALTKMLRLQQVTSGYVRDDEGVDHEVGREKADHFAELLDELPVGEPVVVFARFKHDLALIRRIAESQGRRCGEVSGNVKGGDEYGLNEHSQMRDDIDVIVLQLQSGGVGIDLTRAAYAFYYSLDFSLGNYDQSLARLDRPGQKRPVTYFHLIAKGTLDEVVYRALRTRRDVVESVIRASRKGESNADSR